MRTIGTLPFFKKMDKTLRRRKSARQLLIENLNSRRNSANHRGSAISDSSWATHTNASEGRRVSQSNFPGTRRDSQTTLPGSRRASLTNDGRGMSQQIPPASRSGSETPFLHSRRNSQTTIASSRRVSKAVLSESRRSSLASDSDLTSVSRTTSMETLHLEEDLSGSDSEADDLVIQRRRRFLRPNTAGDLTSKWKGSKPPTRRYASAKASVLSRMSPTERESEETLVISSPRDEDVNEDEEANKNDGQAKERFQHAIKIILILLRWISSLTEKSDGGENGDKQHGRTFTDIAQEAFASDELKNSGLSFDVSQFKAKKEVNMTNEVKTILSTPSKARTTEQLQAVLYGLQHLKSFAEYPLHMQEKLCKVAWFQNVPPKRVIIRQGHFAENFYFILSGQAVVRILEKNPKTGETNLRTATVMRKGTSFGELALLHRSRRTATVVSQDAVQLLTIGRDDFFDIFMSGQGPGEIPEHIQFVSGLEFMKDWPCEELLDHPEFCLFHFFKRGVVIVKDSNKSDWLYIVKSGSCQVMKQLRSVVPKVGRGRHALCDDQSLPVRLPKLGTGDVEARVDTRIRRQGTADNYHSPLADINNLLREADLKLSKEGEEIKSFLKLPMRRPAGSANSNADETSQEECNRKEERSLMLRQEPVKVDSFSKSRYRRFPKTREPHFAQSSSRPSQRSASAKHHRPPTATPRPKSETDSQSQIYKGPVFVQVEVLKPKDAFGLNTVNFDDERDKDTTTVSLVSNGAECVMLSKKFFMDHGNELVKKMIRHQIRPYPSESALQENLQTKVDWNVYRKKLIKDAVAFRRHVADFTAR